MEMSQELQIGDVMKSQKRWARKLMNWLTRAGITAQWLEIETVAKRGRTDYNRKVSRLWHVKTIAAKYLDNG
jgi:hypothetical protein